MSDYYDAYITQFTSGCGCPSCNNIECFSSQNYIYKDYDSVQLEKFAKDISNSPDHLCHNLSPLVIDASIFEDLVFFADFVNSIIINEKEIDFTIFEKAIKSPKLFSLIFLDSEDIQFNDFSLDEDTMFYFFGQMRNYQEFNRYKDDMISLASSIFQNNSYDAPYLMRAIVLITLFLSIYDIKNVPSVTNKFKPKQLNDQFFQNLLEYRRISEVYVSFWQDVITNMALATRPYTILSGNQIIREMVSHIEKFAQFNRLKGFPLSIFLFKNERVCSLLDRETEINHLLLKHETLLDFPSFVTIDFKRTIQARISAIVKYTRFHGSFTTPFLIIKVHRDNVLRETLNFLSDKSESELQKPLRIAFHGERGDDSGGLTREFFQIISKEIFSPDIGMFEVVNNSFYWFKQKCLEMSNFKHIGYIVAIALHNSAMLPVRFPHLLYKKLLGRPLSLLDLYEIKPEVARNLDMTLTAVRNGEFDASTLDLRFEVTIDNFGHPETIPLIENGCETLVTNQNFQQFVDAMVNWELVKSVEKQFNLFKAGFFIVFQIPQTVTIFQPEEFDIMISGQTVYNWNELKENAVYSDGYTKDSENILLFWQVFDSFSEENKIDFLMFLTGTKGVPINGLKEIHLNIQKSSDVNLLPVAHTCTEVLQLPDYRDINVLRKNMMICIENNCGFQLI